MTGLASVERPGRLLLAIMEWQRQLVEKQKVTSVGAMAK